MQDKETGKNKNVKLFPSCLTIDVEDGINIAMRDHFNVQMLPTTRVVSNLKIILDLLHENAVRATFFILGEVAEMYPFIVRKISEMGHEIGVHGYYHDKLFTLEYKKAYEDILKAKQRIEDITGNTVYGFRAPAFSINEKTKWAFNILVEIGFTYDSSVVPAQMGRYGWPGFNKDIIRLNLPGNRSLIEIPLPVLDILGTSFLSCGGGYLRYLPLDLTKIAFTSINKHRPVVMYMHPYELDCEKYPEFFFTEVKKMRLLNSIPLRLYRFRKSSVYLKLDNILKAYPFIPLKSIIEYMDKAELIGEKNLTL